jgi:hypothetical protein
MKLFLSLLIVYAFPVWGDCHLKSPLYSLAGTSTTVLQKLNLLSDKNLKGISVFNPISEDDYKGTRLGGGLFLSRREDKVFSGVEVIYDQGRELDRYFKDRPYASIRIESMGLTPSEVIQKVLDVLTPRLIGCENQLALLQKQNKELSELKFKSPRKIVFFLGEITDQKKYPELVIGNDGFVLGFKKSGQIQTYPSELNYIRWSQKIIQSLDSDFIFVGISEPKDQKKNSIKKIDSKHYNIIFPGALTPGQSQLELMSFIVKNL